jgi:hypothetical protein
MNREFREWFVAERARALAMVLLTRRDDLLVKDTKEESALDYTVYIKTGEGVGNRPFGVRVAATMSPTTLDEANKQLRPVLGQVQADGPFHFPVCVFYFTVKNDQGYYAWAYEPVVTQEGEPRLPAPAKAPCFELNNESLEKIVSAAKRWYEVLDAALTSSTSSEQVDEVANPEFASVADEFEARVRAANISGTTEVTLVYRCVNEQGQELPPVRTSLVPTTKVEGLGPDGPAFAAAIHRDTILGNIDSLVRHAPKGLVRLRDAPQIPLRIIGFDLEIKDINNSAGRKRRRKTGKA